MADFPVAFLFFFDDFECSQALQYCYDHVYDIFDFFQHGVNIIGFESFGNFIDCRSWCEDNQFQFVAYQMSYVLFH